MARAALARAISEAAASLASKGLSSGTSPALARLLGVISKHFAPLVGHKLAAQLAPVVGAAGGATVNALFSTHFQRVAAGHFRVRRLERKYGEATIEREW